MTFFEAFLNAWLYILQPQFLLLFVCLFVCLLICFTNHFPQGESLVVMFVSFVNKITFNS